MVVELDFGKIFGGGIELYQRVFLDYSTSSFKKIPLFLILPLILLWILLGVFLFLVEWEIEVVVALLSSLKDVYVSYEAEDMRVCALVPFGILYIYMMGC